MDKNEVRLSVSGGSSAIQRSNYEMSSKFSHRVRAVLLFTYGGLSMYLSIAPFKQIKACGNNLHNFWRWTMDPKNFTRNRFFMHVGWPGLQSPEQVEVGQRKAFLGNILIWAANWRFSIIFLGIRSKLPIGSKKNQSKSSKQRKIIEGATRTPLRF